MLKTTILAVLIALMSDPLIINAGERVPKAISLGAILARSYSIELVTQPGYVGEEGIAKVIFKPTKGFKWNKDYPASFRIESKNFPTVVPLKERLGHSAFKINDKGAILCVPYKGKRTGRFPVQGLVNFSICNEKECLAFRNQKLTLTFIVLKK